MIVSVNRRAMDVVYEILDLQDEIGIKTIEHPSGTKVIDAGVEVPGSLEAGRLIGEVSMGGLGIVRLTKIHLGDYTLPGVIVATRKITEAIMCSQLAGWQINVDDYFAMGSGPARVLARKEKLFNELHYKDDANIGVIVLETRELPPERVTDHIAEVCGIPPSTLVCIVVPTASLAGSVQISARIVEVGVHKLHKLGFSLKKIRSGHGTAPLSPVAKSDSRAMGTTNDCILYAGRAIYHVRPEEGDDLADLVKRMPSSSSDQYGRPFYDLFKSVDYDFYKIDSNLFSPAEVTINDIETGDSHKAGALDPEVLAKSFESQLGPDWQEDLPELPPFRL